MKRNKKRSFKPILIKEEDIRVRKPLPKGTRIHTPIAIYSRHRLKRGLNKAIDYYNI